MAEAKEIARSYFDRAMADDRIQSVREYFDSARLIPVVFD